MNPKEHSFTFDPIEGSDTLSMMTVVGNYEGTYGDLLQFVNRLDKSQRFLIIDTMSATPHSGHGKSGVSASSSIPLCGRTVPSHEARCRTQEGRHSWRAAAGRGRRVFHQLFVERAIQGYKPPTSRSGTAAPGRAPGAAAPAGSANGSPTAGRLSASFVRSLEAQSAAKPVPIRRRSTRRCARRAREAAAGECRGNASQHFRFRSGAAAGDAQACRSLPQRTQSAESFAAEKPSHSSGRRPPAAPKAPPVPLKFYRLHSPANQPNKAGILHGRRRHSCRPRGDVVKSRYKIVRIGVNSVVVEDTQFKSQQTLPLEEQPA